MFLHGFIFFNFWHLERKFFRFLLTNYTKTQAFKKLFIFCWKKWPWDHCGVMSVAKQTRPGEQDFLIFFIDFGFASLFFQTFWFVFQVKSQRWKLATHFKYFGFRIKLSILWMVQNYCHIPAYIFFFFWLQIENILFYLFSIPLWKIKFLKMRLFHRKNGKIVHNSKHAKNRVIVRRTRHVKNFASFTQVLAFFLNVMFNNKDALHRCLTIFFSVSFALSCSVLETLFLHIILDVF